MQQRAVNPYVFARSPALRFSDYDFDYENETHLRVDGTYVFARRLRSCWQVDRRVKNGR